MSTRLLSGGGNGVLVTGGAGFIGTNLVDSLLADGKEVIVFDNLSRNGVERNIEWLRRKHGDRIRLWLEDIRDEDAVRSAVASVSEVYHFAAQVAVTTSFIDPVADFEINLRGTLNILEAARTRNDPPSIVFTSTNKVFGNLCTVPLIIRENRYEPLNDGLCERGIAESQGLDFHSPYGCSKGGADQYVLDYARSFGLATVVFRMSCIYGPHQMGTEDQGWVAHFLISAMEGRPITLYGDGMQVRDILYVDDLVRALRTAQQNARTLSGRAFSVGGGPANAITLRDLLERIALITGHVPSVSYAHWRRGDQKYFVADTSAIRRATGWKPRVGVNAGIRQLHEWLTKEGEVSESLALETVRKELTVWNGT
ncbi:MAG: SDR family NAD(P)-dependent oxidoreductase [Chitinivibrionales bacterium]|nr:SDR family NAD(P)-dependent oxidoreductase [Chitinivibrionales bacterium]MBD3356670.1 SDR family NAD(P)-dependent oxidoreductase [Chitinivibrionales bacterium]